MSNIFTWTPNITKQLATEHDLDLLIILYYLVVYEGGGKERSMRITHIHLSFSFPWRFDLGIHIKDLEINLARPIHVELTSNLYSY